MLVIVKSNSKLRLSEKTPTLEFMQNTVSGYIEVLRCEPLPPGVVMVVDEDGANKRTRRKMPSQVGYLEVVLSETFYSWLRNRRIC